MAGDWADFTHKFQLGSCVDGGVNLVDDVDKWRLDGAHELRPRYNIAPCATSGHDVPVVGASGLSLARFWYVPSWWNQPLSQLPTAFNARSEELSQKKFFRGFRRVLIPTSGWREFVRDGNQKRAFAFERGAQEAGGGEFFSFAGIASDFIDPVSREAATGFAILTTIASPLVRPYHHRMPLLLPQEAQESWLDDKESFEGLVKRLTLLSHQAHHDRASPLSVYEVSTWGNSTRVEGPACMLPIEQMPQQERQQKLFD
ncbi:MAG: SOS response-associated peptidase [Polyangiaceae bacterium]|nr:SOS response-associated peptidase [Polyangiaceae bacterium]